MKEIYYYLISISLGLSIFLFFVFYPLFRYDCTPREFKVNVQYPQIEKLNCSQLDDLDLSNKTLSEWNSVCNQTILKTKYKHIKIGANKFEEIYANKSC